MNATILDCRLIVATVPTACGIETDYNSQICLRIILVATVPTACGIETLHRCAFRNFIATLQQCLPLAVLKLRNVVLIFITSASVATVPTACGIETRRR